MAGAAAKPGDGKAGAAKTPEVKSAALVSVQPKAAEETADEARWQPVLHLPCQLTVDLPLPAFRISDLLKLQTGSVIGTNWNLTHDVPLRINGTLIGWSEFEVVGNRLAVRLTELA